MKKKTPWYIAPYALLTIGIILAGYVAWRIITREHTASNLNANTTLASCGNGICENVACLSTNCPKPESEENCPQDCTGVDGATGSTDSGLVNVNEPNVNASADGAALRYVEAAQTAEQSTLCPKADMNLTVTEALALATKAGLTQGIKDIAASLYHYGSPLDQCVWEFKNYLSASRGANVIVIDSTQEIFERSSWGS